MSDRMNDGTGRVLGGRYRVEEELGRGGMAKVFKATDTVLGRPVAVKVLAPQFAEDANFVTRFRREAQAAARLNHPNLVGVYDTGSDDGLHYIVMEYVEAKTLADFLQGGGRIMPDRAVELAGSVCDALTVAHAQGVIHRDIKPANIMVTRAGEVKVTDFGIARMTSNETVAQTAAVLGTASYLSPEQAQGQPVDQRSDIYSLGCVLYEMVTGQPPFSADSAVAVASKHVLEQPVPPSRLNPDVSPELQAVILRALSKNPDNRYQTAEEMKTDLERVRRGQPVMATPVMPESSQTQVIQRAQPQPTAVLPPTAVREPRDRTPGWLIALVVFLVLAVLGVLLWLFARELLSGGEAQEVRVPGVVGFTQEAAEREIREAGLEPVVDPQVSQETPGTVIDQSPPEGRLVEDGSKVTIVVARAPKQVEVPDLSTMTVDQAQAALEEVGLELGDQTPQESTEEAGTIIGQNPPSGTPVDKGSAVHVTVATAPEPVLVPNLVCDSIGHAESELEGLGFGVDITEDGQFNPDCPQPNQVAAMSPTGEQPQGTIITLIPTTNEPTTSPTASPTG